MERSGVIPGKVGVKAVNVHRAVLLRRKPCPGFCPELAEITGKGDAALRRKCTASLQQGDKFRGVFPEGLPGVSLHIFAGMKIQRSVHLCGGAPCHTLEGVCAPCGDGLYGILPQIPSVDNGTPADVLLNEFHGFVPKGAGVNPARLGYAVCLQEGKKTLPGLLRFPQGRVQGAAAQAGASRALGDRPDKRAFCQRGGEMAQNASPSCGLSENGHVFRIASKGGNVFLYPVDCGELVKEAVIAAGMMFALPREFGMREETEAVDPVVDTHKYHASSRHALSVEFHFGRIAAAHAAAEDPYHHGKLFAGVLCGAPDVQIQAVFAHGNLWIHVPFFGVDVIRRIQPRDFLHGNRAKPVRLQYPFPGKRRLGRSPAQLAHGRCGKGNPLEGGNPGIGGRNSPDNSVTCCNLSEQNHLSSHNKFSK